MEIILNANCYSKFSKMFGIIPISLRGSYLKTTKMNKMAKSIRNKHNDTDLNVKMTNLIKCIFTLI